MSAGRRGGSELDASAASILESAREWAQQRAARSRDGEWKWQGVGGIDVAFFSSVASASV